MFCRLSLDLQRGCYPHRSRWGDEEIDRVAVFNSYNVVGNKWHKWEPHLQHVAEMPFKRQTLFRPVYLLSG
ncbi:MAG: hypothetical protein QGH37_05410 [Candidatus Poribacteria bacterium]|nr:hypothetical protein [Candidatus Poribacteria bacterium]MDP6997020.1 hypothetical protein [Candidatus Poribacteria bacterium]